MTEVIWLKARCPICRKEYEYTPDYKPSTCGDFDCLHKFLHPELRKEVTVYKDNRGRQGTKVKNKEERK